MRQRLFQVLFFLSSVFGFSQVPQHIRYQKVDAYARNVKQFKNLKDLQKKLTPPAFTEEQKIRSLFVWVACNIAYDNEELRKDSCGLYPFFREKLINEGNYNDKTYNWEIVSYVLTSRKGICDGYSRLFKTLCDSAGLKCEIVVGVAKNDINMIGSANKSNHAWNAVQLNGAWKLLDATWARDDNDDSLTKFTKKMDECYFFSDPLKLSYNHFPNEKKWFLLASPVTKSKFDNYPLVYPEFFNDEISGFTPLEGSINAKKGTKLQLSVSVKAKQKKVSVSDKLSDGRSEERFRFKKAETKISYEYEVTNDSLKELILYYDNKAILHYRIIH
jgi:hypothetical protein